MKPWGAQTKVHVGKRKNSAVTATPMGTSLAQNTTLKLAINQAPTTYTTQHDRTQWVATWKENLTLATPDKLGQHVGM